ncbi:MAG: isopentenyl phosphate kinase [Anaerolineales bacterium]
MVTLLKLGGAAITDKDQPETLRPDALASIAASLARATTTPLIIVHGAGSFGHLIAREYALHEGLNSTDTHMQRGQLEAMVQLQRQLHTLNRHVVDALLAENVPAWPVHPASMCVLHNGRLAHLALEPIERALAAGLVPVLYGDCVWDRAQTFGIISGDQLMIYLADQLGAARVGFGTNVPGVFDADDNVIPHMTREALSTQQVGQSAARADVTGGMRGKLAEIARLTHAETSVWIFDILNAAQRDAFLRGDEALGTRITP